MVRTGWIGFVEVGDKGLGRQHARQNVVHYLKFICDIICDLSISIAESTEYAYTDRPYLIKPCLQAV